MESTTTKIEFTYIGSDFFDIVEKWAGENGYSLKESSDNKKLYQRGSYLSLNAHSKVLIEFKDNKAVIECWINPIWGGRMEISYDRKAGAWAREAARNQINKLLEKFGQNSILVKKYDASMKEVYTNDKIVAKIIKAIVSLGVLFFMYLMTHFIFRR